MVVEVELVDNERGMIIDRSSDRRWRSRQSGQLPPGRREGFDRRALAAPAPSKRGMIRAGIGEARPPRQRRRYLDSGME